MGLSDITDREAVERAIEEYDELGQDAFLSHYGYRRARQYFLEFNGHRYDSKAILGVAHKHQFPDKGPLSPDPPFQGRDRRQPTIRPSDDVLTR